MNKTYRVTGGARFKGHAPGETFQAEFGPEDEKRFIERGSIELADESEAAAPVESVKDNPDPDGDGQKKVGQEGQGTTRLRPIGDQGGKE